MARGRRKTGVTLTDDQRAELVRARRPTTAQALALRARIILACAEGGHDAEIGQRVGAARMTVGKWRRRYLASGADGLLDESRPGAPRRISDEDVERVIAATLESKLADATHWSTRSMAREAGGHEDLKTTMRYMHLSPAARESAIRLLDGRPEIAPIFGDIVESGTLEG